MFEALDAALFDPTSGTAYFFAGDRFLAHRRGRPGPVQTLGVDRWKALPLDLRSGLDAVFWHPRERAVYFVRGTRFAVHGERDLLAVGTLGVDAFRWLPKELHSGIDTAFYCGTRETLCFIRGDRYVESDPWTGRTDGGVRPLSDWKLGAFASGDLEAAFEDEARRIYFFRRGQYLRWDPPGTVEAHYPVRAGKPYGRGLPTGRGGGWLGLSRIIAGPLVGPVGTTTASVWVWTIDRATADRLRLDTLKRRPPDDDPGAGRADHPSSGAPSVPSGGAKRRPPDRDPGAGRTDDPSSGSPLVPAVRDVVPRALRDVVDGIHRGSQIVALDLTGLDPGTAYELELRDGDRGLGTVAFHTAHPPAEAGRIELVVGSCADTVAHRDVPVFARMAEREADVAILHGDNCYYVNFFGSSSDSMFRGGWASADWDSAQRMLLRQLAARNHPDFDALARRASLHATWDDHDFGYNNGGGHDTQSWAGRDASAAVHRAMWPAPYAHGAAIYHAFRTGPVEVFVTDNRYEKDAGARVMLGDEQLSWLLAGLAASTAPVVVLVLASQFLYREKQESFRADAPLERAAIMDALGVGNGPGVVKGRVLLVTGDVHYSELLRAPVSGAPRVLELTSSSIRTGERDDSVHEWVPGSQVWAIQADAFATITVDVRGWRGDAVDGTITIEARDDAGALLVAGDRPCRTVWNLADGTYVTGA